MKITKRRVIGVDILDLVGKLTIGVGDVPLREGVVEALESGSDKIVINLDRVKSIDSSGLGELIRCKVTATSKNAEIKLLKANLNARKLLTMSSLVGVFEMFDNEEMAVASFS